MVDTVNLTSSITGFIYFITLLFFQFMISVIKEKCLKIYVANTFIDYFVFDLSDI